MAESEQTKARRMAYRITNREAIRAAARAHYAANRESIRAKQNDDSKKNRDKRNAYMKAYREANREKCNARDVAYRAANRERCLAVSKAWVIKNAGRWNAYHAKRRADKIRATPKWADLGAIKAVYLEAKQKGMEVDHIVPLRGRTVCGLHVQNNLQLLTKRENTKKNNRWAVT